MSPADSTDAADEQLAQVGVDDHAGGWAAAAVAEAPGAGVGLDADYYLPKVGLPGTSGSRGPLGVNGLYVGDSHCSIGLGDGTGITGGYFSSPRTGMSLWP